MRLEYGSQAAAEAKANVLHNWLISNNPAYARSVEIGQTLRWDIPRLDAGNWTVYIKARCLSQLTGPEVAALR
jgi:hypothetical protein